MARVLGWGAAFDDEAQLINVLEKMEHAQIKMLDRYVELLLLCTACGPPLVIAVYWSVNEVRGKRCFAAPNWCDSCGSLQRYVRQTMHSQRAAALIRRRKPMLRIRWRARRLTDTNRFVIVLSVCLRRGH